MPDRSSVILFKDSSQSISYTTGVNGVCQVHGIYWLIDFIAAQQKRLRKDRRFRGGQRWVHKVLMRRATLYCYAIDDDENPAVFPQHLYSAVTEPEITLYLEEDVLRTEEERDVEI
jgi:hypothetical protein